MAPAWAARSLKTTWATASTSGRAEAELREGRRVLSSRRRATSWASTASAAASSAAVAPNEAVALDLRRRPRRRRPGRENALGSRARGTGHGEEQPAGPASDRPQRRGDRRIRDLHRVPAYRDNAARPVLREGVADFEASPHMDDRSKFDDAAVRGVSLFSASSACTLKVSGRGYPQAAPEAPRRPRTSWPCTTTTTTSRRPRATTCRWRTCTWASSPPPSVTPPRSASLSPIPKGRSTLQGRQGRQRRPIGRRSGPR